MIGDDNATPGAPDHTDWLKSTRSNPSQNCVEIRLDRHSARIRDSKNTAGPVLDFAPRGLSALLDSIRRGDLHA